MKIITNTMLRGACHEQRVLFKRTFPDGAPVTVAAARKARKVGLDVSWLSRLLPKPLDADYLAKCKPLDADYEAKLKPLYDVYWAKRQPLYDDYEAKLKPLDADYLAKLKPLDADYLAKCDALLVSFLRKVRLEEREE